jgi:hypothetical protein
MFDVLTTSHSCYWNPSPRCEMAGRKSVRGHQSPIESLSCDNLEGDWTMHGGIGDMLQHTSPRPFVANEETIKEGDLLNPSPTKPQSPNMGNPTPTTSSFYNQHLLNLARASQFLEDPFVNAADVSSVGWPKRRKMFG